MPRKKYKKLAKVAMVQVPAIAQKSRNPHKATPKLKGGSIYRHNKGFFCAIRVPRHTGGNRPLFKAGG